MTQRYAHLRDDALRKASGATVSKIAQAASNSEKENEDKVISMEDRTK